MTRFVGKAIRQWRHGPGRYWGLRTPDWTLYIHRHSPIEFYWYVWNRRGRGDSQGWATSVHEAEAKAEVAAEEALMVE